MLKNTNLFGEYNKNLQVLLRIVHLMPDMFSCSKIGGHILKSNRHEQSISTGVMNLVKVPLGLFATQHGSFTCICETVAIF